MCSIGGLTWTAENPLGPKKSSHSSATSAHDHSKLGFGDKRSGHRKQPDKIYKYTDRWTNVPGGVARGEAGAAEQHRIVEKGVERKSIIGSSGMRGVADIVLTASVIINTRDRVL